MLNNNYKAILKNSFFLTILEIIELGIPFVALPFIIKTVGADNYGKIAFAQSIVSYFVIVINFGINIIAAKMIAVSQNDKEEINKIFGSVIIIKMAICLLCFLVYCCLILFWNKTNHDLILFFFAYGICLTDIFFTRWLFQGLEKMFMITVIRSSSLLIYIALLYCFLKNEQDYYMVPLFQSGSLVFTSVLAILYTVKIEKIRPVYPGIQFMKKMIKECTPFFFSRASVTINTSIGTTIIGTMLSDHYVACYDLSIKIARTAIVPIDMIGQAIYPYNSRKKDSGFALIAFIGIMFVLVFLLFVLYYCIPFLIEYLGKGELEDAVPIARLLLLFSFMGALSIFLGTPFLVAWGYNRPFNNSVYIATALLVGTYLCYYILDIKNIFIYCASIIFAEAGLSIYRLYHCIKNNIFSIATLKNLFNNTIIKKK